MRITDFKYCGLACGIYLIKNLINQRVYVGQTCRKFKERWTEHVNLALNLNARFNVTPIILALRKYGVENFDFSVLELCAKEELDAREQFWIRVFNADSKDNYNLQNFSIALTKPSLSQVSVIYFARDFNSSVAFPIAMPIPAQVRSSMSLFWSPQDIISSFLMSYIFAT